MIRPLPARSAALVLALLSLTGCARFDGSQAPQRVAETRVEVGRQVGRLADALAANLGGRPALVSPRYGLCMGGPEYGVEVDVVSEFHLARGLDARGLRRNLLGVGAQLVRIEAPQGILPTLFLVKYRGHDAEVSVKNRLVQVGATGRCVRVTSEQADRYLMKNVS